MAKVLRVIDPRLYDQLMQIQQKIEPTKIPTKESPDHKSGPDTNLKEFIIKTIEQVNNNNNKEQDNTCESDNESDIILMKKQKGGGELHHYVKLRKSSIKKTKPKKTRAKKNK